MKKKVTQLAMFGLLMVGIMLITAVMFAAGSFASPLVVLVPAVAVALMIAAGRGIVGMGQAGFAALAADRDTPARAGEQYSLGVATAKKIYAGSLVMRNAAGYATPGAAATLGTAIGFGRANETVDNPGADGALPVQVDKGVFRFGNSAAGDAITIADRGKPCYIVDDQTVARTSNNGARCVAGRIADVDTVGVWVDFRYNDLPGLAQRDVVALADAPATLTADQLINKGIFTITPSAGRALTTDTAALLVAGATGCKVGDTFQFTVVCLAAFAATITAGAGVTLVGVMGVTNVSGTFIGRFTNVSGGAEAVTIYRM